MAPLPLATRGLSRLILSAPVVKSDNENEHSARKAHAALLVGRRPSPPPDAALQALEAPNRSEVGLTPPARRRLAIFPNPEVVSIF
jgi:hypothetical protein